MPPISTQCGFNTVGSVDGSTLLVLHGPTLIVDIGFDANYTGAAGQTPDLSLRGIHALVDTGACESFIDDGIATSMKLAIVDRQDISGSSGKHTVNMYLAQIHVPTLYQTVYGRFGGVDLVRGGQRHSVLIGRTFLRAFQMHYDGLTGTVTLTRP